MAKNGSERYCKLNIRDSRGNLAQLVPQEWVDKQGRHVYRIRVGSGIILYLDPGQAREDEVNASESYILTRPGKYAIRASFYYYETKTWVKSRSITVTVTP